ncbi:hypothetical protein SK128_009434 [Halocaridina rubra]|uniref:Ionotropic glutamate receptor C-terminal domain-containing protein n=1 Tax=Halocaridina rubra TaxID=373956 RepID=A0AAN8WB16_HALRR
MGETIRGDTDISFANYFITADRLKIIDMTRFYYIDYTCFITPMPKPLPQYTAVAWPFKLNVWIAVLLMLILLPPVVRLTGNVEPIKWYRSLNNGYWYILGVVLNRPPSLQIEPVSSSVRIVVLFSWIGGFILVVIYQSSLIAFLLVPLPAQPVNTLEDLLESGLHWGVRDSGGWGEWFSNSIDPTSRKIAEGFEFVRGIDGGISRVLEGNFAFMNSGTFLRYLVSSNFTNEYGQTTLHVTRECFVPFRIGLGMPRFSVYTKKFNAVISRVVEAGMVSHWFQNLLDKAEKKQREKSRKKQEQTKMQDPFSSTPKSLSLYHMQGAFILLVAGWVLSALVYLWEILLWYMCRCEPAGIGNNVTMVSIKRPGKIPSYG